MNRKIENFFSSLDTLHEASVTDYTQNKIVFKRLCQHLLPDF